MAILPLLLIQDEQLSVTGKGLSLRERLRTPKVFTKTSVFTVFIICST